MNQKFSTELADGFCSRCNCEESQIFHFVWYEGRVQTYCTSCVLLSHKKSFCPTCLTIHDFTGRGVVICCGKCRSYSHVDCVPSNGSSSRARLLCSSCINPYKLVCALKEVKAKKAKGRCNKAMDKKAADLHLTAAKIATISMSNAGAALPSFAETAVAKAVVANKKATDAINRVFELEDIENGKNNVVGRENNTNVVSIIDSLIHSDGESYPETLRESGRLQKLTVEGGVSEAQSSIVAMNIDLNEECPSEAYDA